MIMQIRILYVACLTSLTVALTACGGGSTPADANNQQPISPTTTIPVVEAPAPLPAPVPAPTTITGTPTTTTPPASTLTTPVQTASCEGQNGGIDITQAAVLVGRALTLADLATLKGSYCNNVSGKHQIRTGGPYTTTDYSSCTLKVEDNGRFTLTAGEKSFTALVDGSSLDRTLSLGSDLRTPLTSSVYGVTAATQVGNGTVEDVLVLVHRGRVVSAGGRKFNMAAGPLNDENLLCKFLNPTRVSGLAQSNFVGAYATASDLASTLVGSFEGKDYGLVQGKVVGNLCTLVIDQTGGITITSPEKNPDTSEFTGNTIKGSAKLTGNGFDSIISANSGYSVSASGSGVNSISVEIDQTTQRVKNAFGTFGGGLCQIAP